MRSIVSASQCVRGEGQADGEGFHGGQEEGERERREDRAGREERRNRRWGWERGGKR